MEVRWSARAASDFDAILEYIAQDSELSATRQARIILAATRRLEQFPQSGPSSGARGIRELFIPGTPYVLRYSLKREAVELISITHSAMRKSKR